MNDVLEKLKKKRTYHTPILFAEWTGWLFWIVIMALFGWWIYILANAPEPVSELADKAVKPNLPRIVEYSVTGSPFTVDVYRVPVSILFPISDLMRNARSCRQNRTEEQFRTLLQTFAQDDGQVYSFRYLGDVSDNGILPVVAIPNRPHYRDLAAFKKDFDSCLNGSRYPYQVTDDWLLFIEDCPTPGPPSRGVAGCALIRAELIKTMKLNEDLKLTK